MLIANHLALYCINTRLLYNSVRLILMMLSAENNDGGSCGSGSSGGSVKFSASWKQQLVCSHHPTADGTQKPTRGKNKSVKCVVKVFFYYI